MRASERKPDLAIGSGVSHGAGKKILRPGDSLRGLSPGQPGNSGKRMKPDNRGIQAASPVAVQTHPHLMREFAPRCTDHFRKIWMNSMASPSWRHHLQRKCFPKHGL